MTRTSTRTALGTALATVVLSTGAALALQPGVASAGEFGQHVRQCAQEHGFNGSHNPGMHRGAAGWHPATC